MELIFGMLAALVCGVVIGAAMAINAWSKSLDEITEDYKTSMRKQNEMWAAAMSASSAKWKRTVDEILDSRKR